MMFLFYHLNTQTLPPKIRLNKNNNLKLNKGRMVGEVVFPLFNNINGLYFTTVFLASLIFKDFLQGVLPPFLVHL